MNPIRVIVVGADGRGTRYTKYMAQMPDKCKIVGETGSTNCPGMCGYCPGCGEEGC